VPLHVTGFFKPYICDDPLRSGSVGAGLVLEPGLRCEVRRLDGCGPRVLFNGREAEIQPVNLVLEAFGSGARGVEVRIDSPAPIGVGYGVSGSAALAVAIALSRLAGVRELEAARLAHAAEVRALTGLGDVIAVYEGRELELRTRPGAPGLGSVTSFRVPRGISILALEIGTMHTAKMLTEMRRVIEEHGTQALERFAENPTIWGFFECSRAFSRAVGFMPRRVEEALGRLGDGLIGYTVKKGVLMAAVEDGFLEDAAEALRRHFGLCRVFRPGGGVRVCTG